jgi:hypothetical protein
MLNDSLDFIAFKASRTDISPLRNSVDSDANALQVGLPGTARFIHGVTSGVAEHGTFVTNNAPSSHLANPL